MSKFSLKLNIWILDTQSNIPNLSIILLIDLYGEFFSSSIHPTSTTVKPIEMQTSPWALVPRVQQFTLPVLRAPPPSEGHSDDDTMVRESSHSSMHYDSEAPNNKGNERPSPGTEVHSNEGASAAASTKEMSATSKEKGTDTRDCLWQSKGAGW